MTEQSTGVTYRDPSYCCMNCGCETFRERQHPYDECVSCGARRDLKRGSNSEGCEVLTDTEQPTDGAEQKCAHEAAWGELNAALHAKRDAASVGEFLGGDGLSDDLTDLIEQFNDIAEKHGVETFEECWDESSTETDRLGGEST
jgi:DNA-directed RNA polymerase subunit RPC12/RpoP